MDEVIRRDIYEGRIIRLVLYDHDDPCSLCIFGDDIPEICMPASTRTYECGHGVWLFDEEVTDESK